MIKIGDLELVTGAPDPERLLASTGQSIGAMRQLLDGHVLACHLAAAINACLEEERDVHEFAVRIAAAGLDEIRRAVREIFGGDEPEEAEPEAQTEPAAPVKPEPSPPAPAAKPKSEEPVDVERSE